MGNDGLLKTKLSSDLGAKEATGQVFRETCFLEAGEDQQSRLLLL